MRRDVAAEILERAGYCGSVGRGLMSPMLDLTRGCAFAGTLAEPLAGSASE